MGGIIGGGKARGGSESGQDVLPFLQQSGTLQDFVPVQNEFFTQVGEALRTGGVGAQLPMVSRSVEESRSALTRSLAQTEDDLARTGLARTPFGANVLAQTRQSGEQAVARIPTDFANQLITQTPQLIQGTLGAVLGSLASVGRSRNRSGPFST